MILTMAVDQVRWALQNDEATSVVIGHIHHLPQPHIVAHIKIGYWTLKSPSDASRLHAFEDGSEHQDCTRGTIQ